MDVELIYDADCPGAPEARAMLTKAFAQTGIPEHWREWERHAPNAPGYVKALGSPTILVNGKDVAGEYPAGSATSCRIYAGSEGGFSRTPPLDSLCSALLAVRDIERPPTA